MAKVPFPEVPIGEMSVSRRFTAPGLFTYRHLQAEGLLNFPDWAGGDLTDEQRRNALDQTVQLHRPLTAIVIFLNVVALEDLFRDLGARLADIEGLSDFFPTISELHQKPKPYNPDRPFARLDKDPAPLLDFEKLNKHYSMCLGVSPIPESEFPRLYDLALVRHTVAHYGAIFRSVDVNRLLYYEIAPGRLINPPVEFVKETCQYLSKIGRDFEDSVKQRIFSIVLPKLGVEWPTRRPKILVDIIEVFDYLGKLVTSSAPIMPMISSMTDYENWARNESERFRIELIELCIAELKDKYERPTSVA
ncbi:MAG TPA: hypothetical protein VLH56_13420 [Dissulfurispiraceae bacterium]|nr:hypothetical protein [Dissulfurispiraceae bacterium]